MAALRVISAVAELLVLYIQFNKGYVDFERNVLRYFVRFFGKQQRPRTPRYARKKMSKLIPSVQIICRSK